MIENFDKPRPKEEISDIDLAFPARALEFMPPWEEIPEQFKNDRDDSIASYIDFAERWSYGLLKEDESLVAREGINAEEAGRQLTLIVDSYAPKHEHKIAAMAMLMSQWFMPPGTPLPTYDTDQQ